MKKTVIIDIREVDEYKKEHISGTINIPMSTFEQNGLKRFAKYKGKEVIILCRSGGRAHISQKLIETNCKCNVSVYEGGILEWKKQGKKVVFREKRFGIPLLRQVQFVIGFLVVVGSLLTFFVNINFILLPLFVGGGLLFAGMTGTCLLLEVVGKLPFNKF